MNRQFDSLQTNSKNNKQVILILKNEILTRWNKKKEWCNSRNKLDEINSITREIKSSKEELRKN